MNKQPIKYEFLEHPADLKIRAFGKNLADLFANAALGMMEFIYGKIEPLITDYETIEVNAEDLDALLVSWLAEILFLTATKHHIYLEYKILKITEKHLIAEVGSCAAKAQDDIKAVTFHDLEITKTTDGYSATVVYDI